MPRTLQKQHIDLLMELTRKAAVAFDQGLVAHEVLEFLKERETELERLDSKANGKEAARAKV